MNFSARIFILLFLPFYINSYSQIKIITKVSDSTALQMSNIDIANDKPEIISHWKSKNTVGVDISEMAFVNWSAGGTSSVSGLFKGQFKRNYKDENQVWSNELIFRYGLNKQEGTELRKTDDVFRINSTYSYRKDTISNWYHSAKFNFNTQFSNGYNYPNTENPISKPFSPAYTFIGVGSEYIYKAEKFNFYASPFTFKNTLVLNQTLANQGAYGVKKATYDLQGNLLSKGEKSKSELGILVSNSIEREVAPNITLKNRLTLFTDYLHNFGNIDVDWQFQADFKVNQHIKANIGFQLIYDEDIEIVEVINNERINKGAEIQLKQALGIGLEYNF